jgi:hypothetical protein
MQKIIIIILVAILSTVLSIYTRHYSINFSIAQQILSLLLLNFWLYEALKKENAEKKNYFLKSEIDFLDEHIKHLNGLIKEMIEKKADKFTFAYSVEKKKKKKKVKQTN